MAEQGTHEELLEQNGRYKELWVSQTSLYEDSRNRIV
jgi:ABC-type multidrug transport system fused ATPase/permease subunit